jgi:hypothetical protein
MEAPALADHRIQISAARWILQTFLGWSAGFALAIALIACVDALGVPINELLPRTRGLIGAGRYIAVVLSGGVVLGVAAAVAWRLNQPRKRR